MNAPTVTISRMQPDEKIWIKFVLEDEVIEVEMTLENFALAVTGRGDAPAKLVRRRKKQ